MSRLQKLAPEEFDPELRDLVATGDQTPLELGLMRIFAHCPPQAKGLAALGGAIRTNRTLSDRLYELVRLRIAFFNQCRSCMAIRYADAVSDGLSEDLVCSLERPAEAPDLSESERAAVRYGELFATNHLAIDDDVYGELRRHFSEAQIVELGIWTAFCVGFGRLAATWDMVEELPDRFRQDGPVTPWGSDAVVVR